MLFYGAWRGLAALVASLAGALPSAPALERLYVFSNPGLGSEGAAALAAAVPSCPRLRELSAFLCQLGEEATARLRGLWRQHGDPAGQLIVNV